ncbi:hypothetical protein ACWDBW_14895 [Streptomyces sp. NPDC001107]
MGYRPALALLEILRDEGVDRAAVGRALAEPGRPVVAVWATAAPCSASRACGAPPASTSLSCSW